MAVQYTLHQLGHSLPQSVKSGIPDGKFGMETHTAVISFQKKQSLVPDGKVGVLTLTQFDQLLAALPGLGGPVPGVPVIPIPNTGARQKELALKSIPTVTAWITFTTFTLSNYKQSLLSGLGDPLGLFKVVAEALNTHFHFDQISDPVPRIDKILANYGKIVASLATNGAKWNNATKREAQVEFKKEGDDTWVPPPAYAKADQGVWFSPQFREWDATAKTGYGPNCRAAMVLHESSHFIDQAIIDYAYEWKTIPFPCLGPFVNGHFYNTLDPDLALKNASCYACFAVHVSRGSDEPRYGAGNPGS